MNEITRVPRYHHWHGSSFEFTDDLNEAVGAAIGYAVYMVEAGNLTGWAVGVDDTHDLEDTEKWTPMFTYTADDAARDAAMVADHAGITNEDVANMERAARWKPGDV